MNFATSLISYFTLSSLILITFGIAGYHNDDTTLLFVDKKFNATNISNTTWEGEAKGYISSAEPESSNIEYLIRLARVSAAVISYSKFATESREAKTPVMEVLWKIEAVSSVNLDTQLLYSSITSNLEKRNIQSIKDELIKLAKPESVSALVNDDYEKRFEKRQIKEALDSIEYRLSEDAYETASVHDVLLASSALLREVGELMEQAVSVQGQIMDKVLYIKAFSLFEATRAVMPASSFMYCDDEVSRMKIVKNGIDQLENKLKRVQESDQDLNNVNAGDFYELAGVAQQMGSRISIAQSCSMPLYVSQND